MPPPSSPRPLLLVSTPPYLTSKPLLWLFRFEALGKQLTPEATGAYAKYVDDDLKSAMTLYGASTR
jgi:hypothetical protein